MHNWSETDFDWEGLGEAIKLMTDYMRRWGRIGIFSKEKYGTARLYTYFYCGGFHYLIYPGFVSNQWRGKWRGFGDLLWKFDCLYLCGITRKIGLVKLINWWQRKIYNQGYQKGLKLFPHLAVELICAADHHELIDGWYKIMYKHLSLNYTQMEQRWLDTAGYLEAVLSIIGERSDKNLDFVGFKQALNNKDVKLLESIVRDYRKFDSL